MKRNRSISVAVALAALACAGASQAGPSATLCVDTAKPGCFSTVQAAVNAAQDGDTIQIGPGTFAGGIAIAKSLRLVGVSAAATIIKGGGPVVTVGDFSGATAPTVSISRVTITGGFTTGTVVGGKAIAQGGGVFIPGKATGNATAATVTLIDDVVTGNRTSPLTVFPPGPPCGPRVCSFASGGGIADAGTLTLIDTRVTDNVAGSTSADPSVATDASGGGIGTHPGATLTLEHSVVSGNRVDATGANAQFAGGAGINAFGTLTIEHSEISGNSSELDSSYPGGATAYGGGIAIDIHATAVITGSRVSWNSVTASDSNGGATTTSGGIDADGALVLSDSSVDHNQISSSVPAASGLTVQAAGAGIENDGFGLATVRDSAIVGNSAVATSATGFAAAGGGAIANLSSQVTL